MIKVHELLRTKGAVEIWSIKPDATVYQALEKMADKNIGALAVIQGDKLIGVFSERDYARKIILRGKCSLDTPVSEIMSTEPVTVNPEQTLDECMALMTEHSIRHLPVLEDERLVGMVSIRDLVQALIAAKEKRIESLESYITGTDYPR